MGYFKKSDLRYYFLVLILTQHVTFVRAGEESIVDEEVSERSTELSAIEEARAQLATDRFSARSASIICNFLTLVVFLSPFLVLIFRLLIGTGSSRSQSGIKRES